MRALIQIAATAALLLAACQPAAPAAAPVAPLNTPPPAPATPTQVSIPTLSPRAAAPSPSSQPPSAPEVQITTSEVSTPTASTAQPSPTAPAITTACSADLCAFSGALVLAPPILPPNNTVFDDSYRFGSTQGGIHDPHHGLEFLNAFGVPVVAAAGGTVVVAGGDIDPTSPRGVWPITFLGPYSNFYGNLVIIEHPALNLSPQPPDGLPQPLYTLYGHLSEVMVQVGQTVEAGQEIGKVGQAGIATGPHLHFEVRLGANNYKASRNPEVWLASRPGVGAIAGRFLDAYGNYLDMPSVVVEYMPDGPQGAPGAQVSVATYEEPALSGMHPWMESFAIGDLEPGWYRLSFPMGGLRQELVQVLPGQVTVVTFRP